jgi:hypothetical protein
MREHRKNTVDEQGSDSLLARERCLLKVAVSASLLKKVLRWCVDGEERRVSGEEYKAVSAGRLHLPLSLSLSMTQIEAGLIGAIVKAKRKSGLFCFLPSPNISAAAAAADSLAQSLRPVPSFPFSAGKLALLEITTHLLAS